jgi:hypothetical protein
LYLDGLCEIEQYNLTFFFRPLNAGDRNPFEQLHSSYNLILHRQLKNWIEKSEKKEKMNISGKLFNLDVQVGQVYETIENLQKLSTILLSTIKV